MHPLSPEVPPCERWTDHDDWKHILRQNYWTILIEKLNVKDIVETLYQGINGRPLVTDKIRNEIRAALDKRSANIIYLQHLKDTGGEKSLCYFFQILLETYEVYETHEELITIFKEDKDLVRKYIKCSTFTIKEMQLTFIIYKLLLSSTLNCIYTGEILAKSLVWRIFCHCYLFCLTLPVHICINTLNKDNKGKFKFYIISATICLCLIELIPT